MKRLFFLCAALLVVSRGWTAARFGSGTLPLVDGVCNSTSVVVMHHQPIFSWENGSAVSSFTVIVSSDALFEPSGELWNFVGGTTTANTINFITRVPYDGAAALQPAVTYFWQVTIFDAGTSSSAASQFTAVAAAVTLPDGKMSLAVDWNNPFDPARDHTVFRYTAKDRDRRIQLRVFTLSGMLVREWDEQTILKDAWYSQAWDGRNSDGELVARGIYLVNLMDAGEKTGVTKKVAVVR